jgi:hypothetical protein
MFNVPGEDIFASWISFILLMVLVIIGIFVFKFISGCLNAYFRNNKKSKEKLDNSIDKTIDYIYGLPKPLRKGFKIAGTVVYIIICLIVIGYANS